MAVRANVFSGSSLPEADLTSNADLALVGRAVNRYIELIRSAR